MDKQIQILNDIKDLLIEQNFLIKKQTTENYENFYAVLDSLSQIADK